MTAQTFIRDTFANSGHHHLLVSELEAAVASEPLREYRWVQLMLALYCCGRQAEAFGHEPKTELALLCVHGLLHLLGWDHATAAERKEMNRITRAALKRSGLTLARARL